MLLAAGADAPPWTLREWRVVDETGQVDASAGEAVGNIARDTRKRGGPDLAFLVVAKLPDDPQALLEERYRAYALGSLAQDDGLLVIVAPAEHRFAWKTGVALEARLPVERVAPVLTFWFGPGNAARDGLTQALVSAAQELLVRGGAPLESIADPQRRRTDWAGLATVGGIVLLAVLQGLGSAFGLRLGRRLPSWRLPAPLELVRDEARVGLRSYPDWITLRRIGVVSAVPLALVLVLARPQTASLSCDPPAGACIATRGGRVTHSVAAASIERLEVRQERWVAHLLAVTRTGNVVLASGEPDECRTWAADLRAAMAREAPIAIRLPSGLDVFLLFASLSIFFFLFMLVPGRGWWTWVDLRRRRVGVQRTFGRSYGLDDVEALEVRTRRDDLADRARRERTRMPFGGPRADHARLLILLRSGRRVPASAWMRAQTELREHATALAEAAGLPLRVPEPVVDGEVPPIPPRAAVS
ncbi:MAG: hypothetical protein U0229_19725 [Anaeromyxobacter sp.]